jgi:hypothetical protein
MTTQTCALPPSVSRAPEIDLVEVHVRGRLFGRVHDLQVLGQEKGLVLKGHAPTYYVKQLAQHLVMEATRMPILMNEIEVG